LQEYATVWCILATLFLRFVKILRILVLEETCRSRPSCRRSPRTWTCSRNSLNGWTGEQTTRNTKGGWRPSPVRLQRPLTGWRMEEAMTLRRPRWNSPGPLWTPTLATSTAGNQLTLQCCRSWTPPSGSVTPIARSRLPAVAGGEDASQA